LALWGERAGDVNSELNLARPYEEGEMTPRGTAGRMVLGD